MSITIYVQLRNFILMEKVHKELNHSRLTIILVIFVCFEKVALQIFVLELFEHVFDNGWFLVYMQVWQKHNQNFTIVVTVTDTRPDLEESVVGPTCSCQIVKARTYASRTLSRLSFMVQSCLKYSCNCPMFNTQLFSTILQVRNKIIIFLLNVLILLFV